MHIDSDILTPSSEPINQFARQLITSTWYLLFKFDAVILCYSGIYRKLSKNFTKLLFHCPFIINFATSPIHAENTLITLHYKKKSFPLFLETTPIKANHLRSILDYIEQEQLTAEKRNHCMKLSKKFIEKNHTANSKSQW